MIRLAVHLSETMGDEAPIELHAGNQILCLTPETARKLIAKLETVAKYTEEWRLWRDSVGCN